MAATAPVAIGTRGTVGSLVRREIEYFNKSQRQIVDMSSSSDHSRHGGFWFMLMSWKRKKRRGGSNRFLPNICSAVDVSDSNRYRILKDG